MTITDERSELLQQFHSERGYIVIATRTTMPLGELKDFGWEDDDPADIGRWRVLAESSPAEMAEQQDYCNCDVWNDPQYPYFYRVEAMD